MSWDVHFINGYSRRVQVAICFYQPNPCSQYGQPWGTRGWWIIEPGDSKYVLETNNRYMYFYAESVPVGRVWAGDPNNPQHLQRVYVPPRRFDSCLDIGSTDARIVTMRRLDLEINNRWRLT
jgi:uncharacterized membrane protein